MDKLTDRGSLFRDDISAGTETLIKTPVLGSNAPEMGWRHPLATEPLKGQEGIDNFNKIVHHNRHSARTSVQVNNNERSLTSSERLFVRAIEPQEIYKCVMTARPIDRIAAAIYLSGKSFRGISEDANLGVNYISQMLNKQIVPKNDILVAICETLDVDTGWALTGRPGNSRIDALLDLFENVPFEAKRDAFNILARGNELSLDDLKEVAEATNTSVESLQKWISGTESDFETTVEHAAFNELASIANGHELEFELLKEALAEAYDIEREIYGQLGPSSARAKLVKEIYALKLTNRSKASTAP